MPDASACAVSREAGDDFMRKRIFGLLAGLVVIALSGGADAQATKAPASGQSSTQIPPPPPAQSPSPGVNLPDAKYASLPAYLAGTWKWERQEPRQTMIMRFGPGTAFFFHNF